MSGSLSSHHNEGDSEGCPRVGDVRRSTADGVAPEQHGALRMPPAPSAPGRQALFQAIIAAHQEPMFPATLSRLLAHGGDAAPRIMWDAVQKILKKGPDGSDTIAWSVVRGLCRHAKQVPLIERFSPSASTVAALISVSPEGALNAFKYLCSFYTLNGLEVAQKMRIHPMSAEASKTFGFSYVKENYAELVQHEDNLPIIAGLLKGEVLRRGPMSLEASLFIREKYEACRRWTGKEAETAMLWHLRDQLTRMLLRAPARCEANLKISLLFPREIPHPALRRDPRRFLDSERWILEQQRFLTDALGIDHAPKLTTFAENGELDSSHFIYLGSFSEARFPGIQSFASRFDRDGAVLAPLARSFGIDLPGIWTGEEGRREPREHVPRNWFNREDEELYEASRITIACRCLAEHYWGPEVSERGRQSAYEFLRAVMRERPYQLALAVPYLRKWPGELYRDMVPLVRSEASNMWRSYPHQAGREDVARDGVVLLDAVGKLTIDLNRLAFDELTSALENVGEATMRDHRFAAFVAAVRTTCLSSSVWEERACAAIMRFPDLVCSAQLARNLAEARATDVSVKRLVGSQAVRRDLEARTWLTYAHSALLFGADAGTQEGMKEVFEARYARSVGMYARWSQKGRSSYRMVVASLYPERIGEISPLKNVGANLFQSNLETRMKAVIDDIPNVSVQGGRYIPWAPAIDGVIRSTRRDGPPVVLLIDGEPYHSVNGSWAFRGFDGHSLLVTKILTDAGYPVLRISGDLGEVSERDTLASVVCAALEQVGSGGGKEELLVVDPPDDFKDIAGRALLYRPSGSMSKGVALRERLAGHPLLDPPREGDPED